MIGIEMCSGCLYVDAVSQLKGNCKLGPVAFVNVNGNLLYHKRKSMAN